MQIINYNINIIAIVWQQWFDILSMNCSTVWQLTLWQLSHIVWQHAPIPGQHVFIKNIFIPLQKWWKYSIACLKFSRLICLENKLGSDFICQLNYLIKLLSFYHPKYCRLTMSYCSCEHGLFLLAVRKKRGKNVCSRLLWQLCPFSTAGGRRGGVGGQQTEDDRNLKSLYSLFIICICSCGSRLARENKTKKQKEKCYRSKG